MRKSHAIPNIYKKSINHKLITESQQVSFIDLNSTDPVKPILKSVNSQKLKYFGKSKIIHLVTEANFDNKKLMKNKNKHQIAKLIVLNLTKKSKHVVDQNYEYLQTIIETTKKILTNITAYIVFEYSIKQLIQKSKSLRIKFLLFFVYYICAKCMFIYGNYNLAILYFYQSLKILMENKQHTKVQNEIQLQIYRLITKMLLQKKLYYESQQFAFKYLRKAWLYKKIEDELIAYDILGMIEYYCGYIELAQYFHNKMCGGTIQKSQLVKLSNKQLQNNKTQNFNVGIISFVLNDQKFNSSLRQYFCSLANQEKSKNFLEGVISKDEDKSAKYLIMHLSRNRDLKNYHYLKFNIVVQEQTKQFYFIKKKNEYKILEVLKYFMEEIKQVILQMEQLQYS